MQRSQTRTPSVFRPVSSQPATSSSKEPLPFYGRQPKRPVLYTPTPPVQARAVTSAPPPVQLPRGISYRFGQRLRELRKERHMTQHQMAAKLGIDRSFISDVERGQKSISLAMMEIVALGMNVEIADLVRGL